MHLVKVQAADSESFRAGYSALPYRQGAGHDRDHLRREEDRLAVLPQGTAKDSLAAARAVDLGSIEEGYS